MPGGHATRLEAEARTEFVAQLIARGCRKGEIKKAFRRKFTIDLGARQFEEYASRARQTLQREAQRPTSETLGEAVEYLQSMKRNSKVTPHVRLLAQEQLNRIHGHYAPQRAEISGPNGGPIQHRDIDEDAKKVYSDPKYEYLDRGITVPVAGNGEKPGKP